MGEVTVDSRLIVSLLMFVITLLVIGPLTWILKTAIRDLRQLQNDFTDHKEALPDRYVRRTEYESDVKDIKSMLTKLFDKIDGKADK